MDYPLPPEQRDLQARIRRFVAEELDLGAPAETNPAPGVFTQAPDPLADPIHRWRPQESKPAPAVEPAPMEPPTADDPEEEH